MHRQSLRILLALTIAAALVVGLSMAGRRARDWLAGQGHYTIAFADIDCPTPPGLSRAEFLAEVQYLGTLPDQLSALDPALTLRVVAAFALHPWVEHVTAVQLRGPDGPRADITLRMPALAVGGRVLDGNGVLLPAGAPTDGVLQWKGTAATPTGPAGAAWGDAGIEAAARSAAALRPVQGCLRLTEVQLTNDGLLFTGGVRLLWGPPEAADAATVEAKLARLRELCAKPEGPGAEVDLRAEK